MAFSLVSTTVNPDLSDAYLDDSIILEFDQDINVSTANNLSVLLYLLPTYNPFNISIQVDGKNLIVKAANGVLLRNSSYELVVVSGSSGLKSQTAEELTSNIVVAFRTKETLKPIESVAVDPVTIIEDHDIVASPMGDDTTILVPDSRPQGDILPYVPCPPDEVGDEYPGGISIVGSGIPTTPIVSSSILRPIGSDPSNYSIGITSLDTITIFWPENIVLESVIPSQVAELSYQVLSYNIDPFSKTVVTIDTVSAIENQLILQVSGLPVDLTNHEFTLVLKPLKIRNIDSTKKNVVEKFNFLGILDPMMCTVDIAKANAGLWMVEFSDKDIYEYSKIIHRYSMEYMVLMERFVPVADMTPSQLVSFSKYVCCSTALDMLTSGSVSNYNTSGAGSKLFVKRRELPGVTIEYNQFSSIGDSDGVSGDPGKESLKRLLKCIEDNKPASTRIPGKGPIAIATGTKSLYDTSWSIPIRRRL